MQIYCDNSLIQLLAKAERNQTLISMLRGLTESGIIKESQPIQIILKWPSLIEHLNLGGLFEQFPHFTPQSELYSLIISLLQNKSEHELLIRTYDQAFVECLTYVKALPQINPEFLFQEIKNKRQDPQHHLFDDALNRHQQRLLSDPKNFMHDLILYLAWDRLCINLAIVFEHFSPTHNIQAGLNVLKNCLVESFEHITAQGRTSPSFFRLIEALYALQMRDENLDLHSDAEWEILCQSASALKPRDKLNDAWFIDAAIEHGPQSEQVSDQDRSLMILTMDSPEKVKASTSLAIYMVNHLKMGDPNLLLSFQPVEVICLREEGDRLKVIQRISCFSA